MGDWFTNHYVSVDVSTRNCPVSNNYWFTSSVPVWKYPQGTVLCLTVTGSQSLCWYTHTLWGWLIHNHYVSVDVSTRNCPVSNSYWFTTTVPGWMYSQRNVLCLTVTGSQSLCWHTDDLCGWLVHNHCVSVDVSTRNCPVSNSLLIDNHFVRVDVSTRNCPVSNCYWFTTTVSVWMYLQGTVLCLTVTGSQPLVMYPQGTVLCLTVTGSQPLCQCGGVYARDCV